jgi:hypothetical protein
MASSVFSDSARTPVIECVPIHRFRESPTRLSHAGHDRVQSVRAVAFSPPTSDLFLARRRASPFPVEKVSVRERFSEDPWPAASAAIPPARRSSSACRVPVTLRRFREIADGNAALFAPPRPIIFPGEGCPPFLGADGLQHPQPLRTRTDRRVRAGAGPPVPRIADRMAPMLAMSMPVRRVRYDAPSATAMCWRVGRRATRRCTASPIADSQPETPRHYRSEPLGDRS